MPRLCFLIALGGALVVSVAAGSSGAESTLLWWHKVLYAAAGGVLAFAALRLLPLTSTPADARRDRVDPGA